MTKTVAHNVIASNCDPAERVQYYPNQLKGLHFLKV